MSKLDEAIEAAGLAAHNAWAKECLEDPVTTLDDCFDYNAEYWRQQGRVSVEAALEILHPSAADAVEAVARVLHPEMYEPHYYPPPWASMSGR